MRSFGGDFNSESKMLVFCPRWNHIDQIIDRRTQIVVRRHEFKFSSLNFWKVKNIVYDWKKPFARIFDIFCVSGDFLVLALTDNHFVQAEDSVNRSADFVRHIWKKVRFCPARRLCCRQLRFEKLRAFKIFDVTFGRGEHIFQNIIKNSDFVLRMNRKRFYVDFWNIFFMLADVADIWIFDSLCEKLERVRNRKIRVRKSEKNDGRGYNHHQNDKARGKNNLLPVRYISELVEQGSCQGEASNHQNYRLGDDKICQFVANSPTFLICESRFEFVDFFWIINARKKKILNSFRKIIVVKITESTDHCRGQERNEKVKSLSLKRNLPFLKNRKKNVPAVS